MTSLLFGALQQQLQGPPDPLPPIPKKVLPEPPKMANQPIGPGNIPGQDDTTTAAGAADEKRRILKTLPKKTENKFAGDAGQAPVKKRVLGGGTGREVTGE